MIWDTEALSTRLWSIVCMCAWQSTGTTQAAKLSGLSELVGRVGMEGLVGTSAVFRFGTGFGAVLVKWAHLAFAHFAEF